MILIDCATSGRGHVLDAGVEIFRVFAKDDEVDVRVVGLQAGKGLDRAEVGVKVELLAQLHVDGAEAAADGRGDGALERDLVGERWILSRAGGDVFAGLGVGVGAGVKAVPLERAACLLAGGFENGIRPGGGDFGTDAVAGDQGDLVGTRGLF